MTRHSIDAECVKASCPAERRQITEVKDGGAARNMVHALSRSGMEKCALCGGRLRYQVRSETVLPEDVSERIKSIRSALETFVRETGGGLVWKEIEGKWMDKEKNRQYRPHWCVVSPEEMSDFEYYEKPDGDVATIYLDEKYYKEKQLQAILGTNSYTKKTMRQLAVSHGLGEPHWSYDQITAPEWMFHCRMDTADELLAFLRAAREAKSQNEGAENEPMEFYFSAVACKDEEGKSITEAHVVEKQDWDLFSKFIYECEHEEELDMRRALEALGVKRMYDSKFRTEHPIEKVREEMLKSPRIHFSESFQAEREAYKKQYG